MHYTLEGYQMGGFFSRFRRPVEKLDESEPPELATPEKLEGADLNADGNDVAMESMELSYEGLNLEPNAVDSDGLTLSPGTPPPAGVVEGIGVKYTMFKEDGTPVRAEPGEPQNLAGEDSSDEEAMAIEKVELAYEKVERVPASEGDGAPDFRDGLITETGLPALDANAKEPAPDGVAQDGEGGTTEYNPIQAWPVKWYVPELDSDSSGVPPIPPDDPEEMTTLQPIAEAKETTGAITFLAADQKTELFEDDNDSDPDDLA
jgi:hypothetical protein